MEGWAVMTTDRSGPGTGDGSVEARSGSHEPRSDSHEPLSGSHEPCKKP